MSAPNWQSNLVHSEAERQAFCSFHNLRQGVHQHSDGTYWWYDETQADEFGGFITFEEARASLDEYAKSLH